MQTFNITSITTCPHAHASHHVGGAFVGVGYSFNERHSCTHGHSPVFATRVGAVVGDCLELDRYVEPHVI